MDIKFNNTTLPTNSTPTCTVSTHVNNCLNVISPKPPLIMLSSKYQKNHHAIISMEKLVNQFLITIQNFMVLIYINYMWIEIYIKPLYIDI